jgi:hypothetical protein
MSGEFKVRYRVQGHEQEFETEYYHSWSIAESHRQDIAGYDGVYNAYLVPKPEETEETK